MARAIPNVHVIQGYAGGDGRGPDKQALMKLPQWFEEPADGAVTTNTAIDKDGLLPIFRITNKIDIFCCHDGKTPNIGTGKLHLLRAADGPHDLYVTPGDAFVWTAAT